MGKHHTAEVYRKFKPLQTAPEYWEEPEPFALTDLEADQEASDAYWDRIDAEASGKRIGEWKSV